MIGQTLILLLVLVCAVTDLVWHKIYNAVTYPGIVAGLLFSMGPQGWGAPGGFEDSLKGLAACGGLMLAAFLLFDVGGGDVKLLAMEGAWLGLERGLECLLWTFVIGGAVALAILVWKLGTWNLLKALSRHLLWSLRLGRAIPLSVEEQAALQPPLYLALAAVPALCIVALDLAGTQT